MVDEKMIRKQLYLESRQNTKIKLISAKLGKTEAEIVREAIDEYLAVRQPQIDDPLNELIGLVKTESNDGSTTHDQDIYRGYANDDNEEE